MVVIVVVEGTRGTRWATFGGEQRIVGKISDRARDSGEANSCHRRSERLNSRDQLAVHGALGT